MKFLALLALLVGCTAKAPASVPEKVSTDAGVVATPDAAKVVDGAIVAPAPKAVDAAPVPKG